MGSRRIAMDTAFQPCSSQPCAEHGLRRGRATDITCADEQDFHYFILIARLAILLQNTLMNARLFVGLALPPPVRKQLAALPRDLPGAKWTTSSNLHLTLTFIGEAPRESISSIS